MCKAASEVVRQALAEPEDFLRRIITMDESVVCFHTPKTKQQSKQWLPKGTPGPIKARVHASRKKQMVMAFVRRKRPELASGNWILDWDNASVHSAKATQDFLALKGI